MFFLGNAPDAWPEGDSRMRAEISHQYDAGVLCETQTIPEAVSLSAARVANIDRLRILAAIGIVWFHTENAPYRHIAYAGLPVFLLIFCSLLTSQGWRGTTAEFLKRRWHRLLKPWLFWSAVYGLCRLANALHTGDAMSLRQMLSAETLLAGPSIHLWYLPYAFLVGAVIHAMNRWTSHIREETVILANMAAGTVLLAVHATGVWTHHNAATRLTPMSRPRHGRLDSPGASPASVGVWFGGTSARGGGGQMPGDPVPRPGTSVPGGNRPGSGHRMPNSAQGRAGKSGSSPWHRDHDGLSGLLLADSQRRRGRGTVAAGVRSLSDPPPGRPCPASDPSCERFLPHRDPPNGLRRGSGRFGLAKDTPEAVCLEQSEETAGRKRKSEWQGNDLTGDLRRSCSWRVRRLSRLYGSCVTGTGTTCPGRRHRLRRWPARSPARSQYPHLPSPGRTGPDLPEGVRISSPLFRTAGRNSQPPGLNHFPRSVDTRG